MSPPSVYWDMPYTLGTITQSQESTKSSMNQRYTSSGGMPERSMKFPGTISRSMWWAKPVRYTRRTSSSTGRMPVVAV